MIFDDRDDAGRRLAERLSHLAGRDVVVLGLPRGGVPVAAVVARALRAPLDVIAARKLGVPFQPGSAMGAVGEDGALVLDEDMVRLVHAGEAELAEVERRERRTLEQGLRRYRAARPAEPLAGRTVIVVDDGAVTGSSARAACRVARTRGASRVVFATPVCSREAVPGLQAVADEVVVIDTAPGAHAVGASYASYPLIDDEDVVAVLARGGPVPPRRPADACPTVDLGVDVGGVRVAGHLVVPDGARGLVVSAHASGSSRFDPRHGETARYLREAGLGTLVIDLLTPREEIVREHVFDVDLLAARLEAAIAAVRDRPAGGDLRIGLLAEGTAAAGALVATARRGDVAAVASCDGRPDLATEWLARVAAPVLLVAGERDPELVELNRRARSSLPEDSRLRVVMGSGRADGDPVPGGAPTRAAELVRDWFGRYLTARTEPLAVAP